MIKQEEKVSIIIPVYNVEQYLEECIESVLNQTYSNYEIILIDDCSTDNSSRICQHYKELDKRIRLIQQKSNQGLSATRNIGINNAIGKYIYFLDSDDFIKDNLLDKVITYMENDNLDLCYFSGEVLLDGDDLTWNMNMYKKNHSYSQNTGIETMKQLYINKEYTVQSCMFISKTSLIKDNDLRYHEGILYEDNYFSIILAMDARKAGVVNDVFYTRRVRPGSIMTSDNKNKLKIYSYIQNINDFNQLGYIDDIIIRKIIRSFIRFFSVSVVKEIIKLNDPIETKKLLAFFIKNKFFYDYKIFGYTIIKLVLRIN